MSGYWNRALAMNEGNIFSMFHWAAWPVFFKIYLSFLFKIIAFIGLYKHLLESVLTFHIFLSSISIVFFYFIAKDLINKSPIPMLATLFYAFSYPLIYLNAFILTENIAIPVFIFSVYLLFSSNNKNPRIFFSGIVFGFTVALKPSLAPIFLSFLFYLLLSGKKSGISHLVKSVIFSLGFFLVIFIASSQIFYISKGNVSGLHNSTGANFFLAQCKYRGLSSSYKKHNFSLGPPLNWKHKEWPTFKTNHPINDQKYFYDLGWECMKKNPHWLKERVLNLKELFLGNLFPGFSSARYFHPLIDISKWLMVFMSCFSLLLYSPLKKKIIPISKVLFLISIPLSVIIVSFPYQPESRYFYQLLFVIELLFFLTYSHFEYIKKKFL